MTKKLFLAILIAVLMMQVTAAVAAPALPGFSSQVLGEDMTTEFFELAGMGDVYKALENKSENVYLMNFTATDETVDPYYKNWYADFVLTSNKDVYAFLIGAFEGPGIVPLGIIELKAGEELQILNGGLLYQFIHDTVQSFYCAAVPITEELKSAWVAAGNDASELSGYYSAASDTCLTLSLRLSDDSEDPSEYHNLSSNSFVYRPSMVSEEIPETGDGANLVLWSALVLISVTGMALLRKKREA